MLGNVWEWTCSLYAERYTGAERECAGVAARGARVIRGGAWYIQPRGVRSAHRNALGRFQRTISIGFRVARDITDDASPAP